MRTDRLMPALFVGYGSPMNASEDEIPAIISRRCRFVL